MSMMVSTNRQIINCFFVLGLYSVLFNFYDFPLLDFVDVCVFLSLLSALIWAKLSLVVVILMLMNFILLTVSNLNGLFYGLHTNFEHLAFYYKWFFILFVLIILQSVCRSNSDALKLNRHILLVGVILCIWVIAYTPLRLNGYITGSWRVSFPFPPDPYVSDAHVLSSLLGIIISFNYINKQIRIFSLLSLLFVAAILMTGSRTGVVLIFFAVVSTLVIDSISFMQNKTFLHRNSIRKMVFLIPVFLISFSIIQYNLNFDFGVLNSLISRALNVGFGDASSQGRLLKLTVAIDELSASGVVLGPGFLQSKLRWYDNGFAILITHGGLPLVTFLGLLFMYLIFKNIRHLTIITQLLLIILAYAITEHFLISRHVVFTVSLFWISLQFTKSPSVERESYVS